MWGVSLLSAMRPLHDAASVRGADARTIAAGTPGRTLMEAAGVQATREVLAAFPPGSAVTVLVGPGNNGGDGMVMARLLAEAGWHVRVQAPGARAPETPDGALMTRLAADAGIEVADVDLDALRRGGRVVIDALLGTGSAGAPRGAVADVVQAVRDSGAPVVAVDMPTGVDADTGAAPGPAIRADLTVTFAADKVGLRVSPGRGLAGRVVVADIGISPRMLEDPAAWLAGDGAIGAIPPKGEADDKYRAGGVLVVGGAPGMSGAVRLSSRAALRTGAGIVVACVPPQVHAEVAIGTPEVMVNANDLDEVMLQASRVSAVPTACGTWGMTSPPCARGPAPPSSRRTQGRPPAFLAWIGPTWRPSACIRPVSSPPGRGPWPCSRAPAPSSARPVPIPWFLRAARRPLPRRGRGTC
jgi:NAD(P)H-hydrate epimerase